MEEQQLNKEAKLCTRWSIWLTILFIFIFPGIMFLTGYTYSLQFFKGWTFLAFSWLVIAGLYITIRPLVEYYKESMQ
jgi:polyferredoxin